MTRVGVHLACLSEAHKSFAFNAIGSSNVTACLHKLAAWLSSSRQLCSRDCRLQLTVAEHDSTLANSSRQHPGLVDCVDVCSDDSTLHEVRRRHDHKAKAQWTYLLSGMTVWKRVSPAASTSVKGRDLTRM